MAQNNFNINLTIVTATGFENKLVNEHRHFFKGFTIEVFIVK